MPSISAVKSSNAAISLAGKCAVVVGGTSGIGKGIALRLAQSKASVTIVGRNEQEGRIIVNEMTAISRASKFPLSGNDDEPTYNFVPCDASVMSNIKECSDSLLKEHKRLDILVLTQGVSSVNGYTPTSDGIERKLAVHYYGRIAFAKCLLPFMSSTVVSPIVLSVLSAGVHAPYADYESDPDLAKTFSIKNAADSAGFYNDIGLDMLSREHPKVAFIHSAPGAVQTAWGAEFPWYLRVPLRGLQSFFRSPEDCAEFHFFSLTRDSFLQRGGFFLVDPNAEETRVTSLHETATDTVWRHTNEVLARCGLS